MSRVAIYTRVSTDKQTTDNQLQALQDWAARAGHTVVKVYEDKGISGTKGRDKRPAFDAMLKGAVRREFDTVAVWSTDRLGRSLQHLIETLSTIRDTGRDLYIHTQALDTSTPSGRAMFGMLAVFGEFEREIIVDRVNAGIARARVKGTKSGKAIGRPTQSTATKEEVSTLLLASNSVRTVAKATKLSVGTVAAVRAELVAAGQLAAAAA